MPSEWAQSGIAWVKRVEKLGELTMWSLKRTDEYQKGNFPWGLVYVFKKGTTGSAYDIIESYSLQELAPLELESIANAMREKYKSP